MSFAVLLPVKPPARGKSRLVGLPGAALSDPGRVALATAFALDTATACLAAASVGAVLAVTDDALFASSLTALGCSAIPDGVTDDLNGSLRLAAAEAARRWPALRPVALCGDLPALRSADLDAALAAALTTAPQGACFVADAAGTGTTLYSAPLPSFDPSYGVDSARLHVAGGAVALSGELVSLRHDVDTLEDLRAAVPLGLGVRTTLAAAELGLLG
ncbi:2-phospho-L-lactate guanylyltransferase [Nocardioides sp. BP30]|uniref:2-phospho-L-lactate guanylyltransferase n=1 Tax=Nocardioides sp. BP30 TaxID=3036374 RepID=UPI002469C59F|nr:2-phospho-L-lactate guanylyltransferase [Nocardioides sp. BP30]WGL53661.1 2-phospho-L-lactate guanylyltransferase [Nocardioides sp. BP30]